MHDATQAKLLTVYEVAERYRVATPTIWRWRRTNADFPKPVSVAQRATRWLVHELDAYDDKIAGERS